MNRIGGESWLVIADKVSWYVRDLIDEAAEIVGSRLSWVEGGEFEAKTFAHEGLNKTEGRKEFERVITTSALRVALIVRKRRPACIILLGTANWRAVAAALFMRGAGTLVVFSSDENIEALGKQGTSALLLKFLCYRILAIRVDLALSLGLTNDLALRYLFGRQPVRAPIYSIDTALFNPRRKPEGNRGEGYRETGRVQVLIVARLVAQKQVMAFVSAVAAKPTLMQGMELTVIGDGPERGALEEASRRFSGALLRVKGACDSTSVAACLASTDLLVLPSAFEPWGIVIIEALAAGIPVLATPAVGAAVSLAGLNNGVALAEGNSASDVCEALERILPRLDSLKEAARAGSSDIHARYGRKEVAASLAEVIRRNRGGRR